jgi:phosphopantothenoylcysteine decarboxylase/phosphopantothenate--cysteine ligase
MPHRRLLITAGPTHEPIDPVRYMGNRSSGKLGVALAEAAHEAGWHVTLLLGPAAIDPPEGVTTHRFETTQDLADLLDEHFDRHRVLVMAAAVADFRPISVAGYKLNRVDEDMVVHFESTPDLVAACSRRKAPHQRIVGFALESPKKLKDSALSKIQAKQLDAVVANPMDTMNADDIDATIYTADGRHHHPGPMPKTDFACWLINWIEQDLPEPADAAEPPAVQTGSLDTAAQDV